MNYLINKKNLRGAAAALLAIGSVLLISQPAQALPQSSKVGFVTVPNVYNGGTLPYTNTAFSGFTFTNIPINGTNPLNLATACGGSACDTVVLNTASSSNIRCNLNVITAAQKQEMVAFVANGGKLIMYDSECASQDYSWLPYSFTTNNPGARGGRGTLTIVEDNNLSSTVSTGTYGSYFINANLIATQTDAIGDMNVMTTLDSNWCLDMSGTNVNNITGPVHTYARWGNGLIIYNGMDTDVLSASTIPSTTNGTTNFAKVWLQELQVPFNPTPLTALTCGATVTGINITPLTAVNDLAAGETTHQVTAHIQDQLNNPQPNVLVSFTIQAGSVNAGAVGTCTPNANCTTDSSGHVNFTYTSNDTEGKDNIQACITNTVGQQVCSQLAEKEWMRTAPAPGAACDANIDGQIDKIDLSLISRSRGQTPTQGDPRDANLDGKIDTRDVKVCIPLCTFSQCATQ